MKLNVYLFKNIYGTTGIVQVEDDGDSVLDRVRYYISQLPTEIDDEDQAANHVAIFGSPFPKNAGDALFSLASDLDSNIDNLSDEP